MGESITHKFQELINLLTTQSIDFMGVEKFDFIFRMFLNSCCKSIKRRWKEILSYNISRIQVSTSNIVNELFELFVYLERNIFLKNLDKSSGSSFI